MRQDLRVDVNNESEVRLQTKKSGKNSHLRSEGLQKKDKKLNIVQDSATKCGQ